jgi:hypothetical protein
MYFDRRRSPDPLAGQPVGHLLGQGPAQVGAVDLRRAITLPSITGKQAAADGFDFGQFGHRMVAQFPPSLAMARSRRIASQWPLPRLPIRADNDFSGARPDER